jgi:hypothetical protein
MTAEPLASHTMRKSPRHILDLDRCDTVKWSFVGPLASRSLHNYAWILSGGCPLLPLRERRRRDAAAE